MRSMGRPPSVVRSRSQPGAWSATSDDEPQDAMDHGSGRSIAQFMLEGLPKRTVGNGVDKGDEMVHSV
jgi:hypothetical protein